MRSGRRTPELERIREDAWEDESYDVFWQVIRMLSQLVVYDRCGRGKWSHGYFDRYLCLQPSYKLVVIYDLKDLCLIDILEEFLRIVRINDDHLILRSDRFQYCRSRHIETIENELCFAVEATQDVGGRIKCCMGIKVPGPHYRASGCVCIGWDMSKDFDHDMQMKW